MDKVANVNPEELQKEALAAVAAARRSRSSTQLRVRYLGRSSELKLALREVRDRETGMTLNAVREALEAAFDARRARARARRARSRRLSRPSASTSRCRPSCSDVASPRGSLHPITHIRRDVEDAFIGLGYEVRRGPRDRDGRLQLRQARIPPNGIRRARRATRSTSTTTISCARRPRRRRSTSMEEKPPPVYMVSIGRVYRRDAITPTRYPIFHQFEGLADRPRDHAGRPQGDAAARHARALRRRSARCASARTTSRSPSRRSSRTSRAACAAAAAARRASARAGSRSAARGWSTRRCCANVGLDPEEWGGFAFGLRARAHGAAALRHPDDPRRSGTTTCAS